MSDTEFMYDSDQDVSEFHSKLVEAVAQLDKGQRVKKAERTEPTLEVSEFHLVKSGISDKDAVHLRDLAKTLGKKGSHLEITKKLESAKQKAKILKKPLEKPAADKIKRVVGFENAKKDLKKWNAVVTRNRTVDSLKFPLKQSSLDLQPSNTYVKRFRLQSELEKELDVLEPQKENIEQKNDEFPMTLTEVRMQRKEAARLRAQQSYKEARARRQNKIKSKKFHRVQRKEKVKLQLKEFEELQKTDPQAALEKLEQLDKSRAEERMTLRHKSTGKWAKNKQIRAKYDKETRQELAQQLSISRELTQKISRPDDSDEEIENNMPPVQSSVSDKENPWVNTSKSELEIDEFIQSYRTYWDEQNKQSKDKTINADKNEIITINSEKLSPVVNSAEDKSADRVAISTKKDCEDVEKLDKFSTEEVIENSPNEISEENKKVVLDGCTSKSKHKKQIINKKVKTKNISDKCLSTSAWQVESIEENNLGDRCDFENFSESNTEKLNKIFDSMDDKIQEQVKSKLQSVKEKYNKITKSDKRTTKKRKIKNNDDQFDGLEIQSQRKVPSLDKPLDENIDQSRSQTDTELKQSDDTVNDAIVSVPKLNNTEVEIDPNKYINVKPKHLNTDLPDVITGGEDALDDSDNEENKHNIINEAFADDDVVDQFRKEKEEEIKKSQPKDIDLTLPGWGNWGGKNVRVSNRKKKRFILKVPKDLPRRDDNKGDVIIIEEDKPKIKEHQVRRLPYPFTSVKDFEASVRMPIGRNFVSEKSHRKLIQPTVETRMGQIIEPMDEDVLVKMPKKNSSSAVIKPNKKPNNRKRPTNKNNIGSKNKKKNNIDSKNKKKNIDRKNKRKNIKRPNPRNASL